MAATERVDVIPCLLIRKGDLVGGKANDISVLFMEFPLARDELTSQEAVDKGQSRRGPESGTRELGERVEVEVVDRLYSRILHTIKSVKIVVGDGGSRGLADGEHSTKCSNYLNAQVLTQSLGEYMEDSHGQQQSEEALFEQDEGERLQFSRTPARETD